MEFRTKIDIRESEWKISHKDKIVMLGSCFTDNIGALLERDGFNVVHNPMGPLYNPYSISNAVGPFYKEYYLEGNIVEHEGIYHCLDFASQYQDADRDRLIERVRAEAVELRRQIEEATVLIFTLGTAYVYNYKETLRTVGNCHKIPANKFGRSRLSVDECYRTLSGMLNWLPFDDRHIIFTVSPIRHLGDGFSENQLSKSTLLLGIDEIVSQRHRLYGSIDGTENAEYFPAYEIMMDDLRDYRFYASDMKHPSDTAIQYIYEQFATKYFTQPTMQKALEHRRAFLRSQHRKIL